MQIITFYICWYFKWTASNRISTTERFYRASKIHNLYPHINYAHISLPIVHNRTRKINLHDITRSFGKRIIRFCSDWVSSRRLYTVIQTIAYCLSICLYKSSSLGIYLGYAVYIRLKDNTKRLLNKFIRTQLPYSS